MAMENEQLQDTPSGSPVKSYFKLWAHAARSDVLLRAIGTMAFLAAGVALPVMTIVFGAFVNDFNDWGSGKSTPDRFKDAVNKNALYLVYIFIARFAVGSVPLKRYLLIQMSHVLSFQRWLTSGLCSIM